MVSISISLGLYEDHLAEMIIAFNLAYKGKTPSKKAKETFNLIVALHTDLKRDNVEERAANDE